MGNSKPLNPQDTLFPPLIHWWPGVARHMLTGSWACTPNKQRGALNLPKPSLQMCWQRTRWGSLHFHLRIKTQVKDSQLYYMCYSRISVLVPLPPFTPQVTLRAWRRGTVGLDTMTHLSDWRCGRLFNKASVRALTPHYNFFFFQNSDPCCNMEFIY